MLATVWTQKDVLLQSEALCVGYGNSELMFKLLFALVRGKADLVETGVRDGQPKETTKEKERQTSVLLYSN